MVNFFSRSPIFKVIAVNICIIKFSVYLLKIFFKIKFLMIYVQKDKFDIARFKQKSLFKNG